MSETILAADLAVGDVYRSGGDPLRVASIRTFHSGATYRVIEAQNLRSGGGASISLRSDVSVEKLEAIHLRDLQGYLLYMAEGDQLSIVRADGKFWA